MSSIFMVHSVLAIEGVAKVKRDFDREERFFEKKEAHVSKTFSEILQQELQEKEDVQMDLHSCQTVTYGMDRKLHRFEYLTREYR